MSIDWEAVLKEGEKPNVDFKRPMAWDKASRVSLTKDIIAMSNARDGGILLVGPAQDVGTGTFVLQDVAAAQLATFDPTSILEFVNRRVAPPVRLHVEKPVVHGRQLVAIVVAEFAESPTVVTLDTPEDNAASGSAQPAMLPGQVYVRTPACQTTVVRAESDMRDLLNRALSKRTDQLLHRISQVMKGSPEAPPTERGAVHQRSHEAFHADVHSLIQRYGPHGWWVFKVTPDSSVAVEPIEPARLQQVIRESAVALRGWDFPHLNSQGIRNRSDGVGSETHWDARSYHEMWRASYQGFFGLIRSCWEDHYSGQQGTPRRAGDASQPQVLWLVSAIYSITEFAQFAKRFYGALGYGGGLELHLWLGGMHHRELGSEPGGIHLVNHYSCDEDVIQQSFRTDLAALQAGWEEQVVATVRWLLAMFNWNEPDRQMIRGHIANLMNRGGQ